VTFYNDKFGHIQLCRPMTTSAIDADVQTTGKQA